MDCTIRYTMFPIYTYRIVQSNIHLIQFIHAEVCNPVYISINYKYVQFIEMYTKL